ncbi:hypothetical protein [Flagellimonas marina]|uniref:Uncharacterized protein n=1 Tax=Flagellimonas marina TaxID=1775168 RepID=A0ABV8PFN5_9FLAO
MEAKKVEDINYKVVFVNAMIGAVATGVTFWLMNRFFKSDGKAGLGIPLKVFASLPVREQARFADEITMKNSKDPKWLVEQLANIDADNPETYLAMEGRSIANCAFIALYGAHDGSRLKCMKILDNLKTMKP